MSDAERRSNYDTNHKRMSKREGERKLMNERKGGGVKWVAILLHI